MKYIAEIISPEEIGVWFLEDGWVKEMKDGLHEIIGHSKTPIMSDPVCIEYKTDSIKYFKTVDYTIKIKEWEKMNPEQPPWNWICRTHIPGDNTYCAFTACIMSNQPIPHEKYELTSELSTYIKEQFTKNIKYNFTDTHNIYKVILLGTI